MKILIKDAHDELKDISDTNEPVVIRVEYSQYPHNEQPSLKWRAYCKLKDGDETHWTADLNSLDEVIDELKTLSTPKVRFIEK